MKNTNFFNIFISIQLKPDLILQVMDCVFQKFRRIFLSLAYMHMHMYGQIQT